jgi:hypothetical protein
MANMAVAVTYQEHLSVRRVEFDWLSDDAAGTAAATTKALNGELVGVQFIPDAAPTQPDNAYDVTLTDPRGLDVLCGLGANLANNASQFYVPKILNGAAGAQASNVPIDGALTLAVAAAGNAKGGTIVLLLR